jgi:hypothetical protein
MKRTRKKRRKVKRDNLALQGRLKGLSDALAELLTVVDSIANRQSEADLSGLMNKLDNARAKLLGLTSQPFYGSSALPHQKPRKIK